MLLYPGSWHGEFVEQATSYGRRAHKHYYGLEENKECSVFLQYYVDEVVADGDITVYKRKTLDETWSLRSVAQSLWHFNIQIDNASTLRVSDGELVEIRKTLLDLATFTIRLAQAWRVSSSFTPEVREQHMQRVEILRSGLTALGARVASWTTEDAAMDALEDSVAGAAALSLALAEARAETMNRIASSQRNAELARGH
jgi:hypothetical protein